jgi:hypothetical protein
MHFIRSKGFCKEGEKWQELLINVFSVYWQGMDYSGHILTPIPQNCETWFIYKSDCLVLKDPWLVWLFEASAVSLHNLSDIAFLRLSHSISRLSLFCLPSALLQPLSWTDAQSKHTYLAFLPVSVTAEFTFVI